MKERLRRWLAGTGTAMLAGAFVIVVVGRIVSNAEQVPVLAGASMGALYGLAVLGLVRLFRVRRWGLVVAGLVCGPVPAALLTGHHGSSPEERGFVVFAAFLGALIGLLEWARQSARGLDGDVR